MSPDKPDNFSILGLIPARGGSKGIPNKNLYPIYDKPLIAYTIEAAAKSELLTDLIVSTDSDEIARVAKEYNASIPFMRPAELASDNSGAKEVVEHAIDYYAEQGKSFDFIVYLQPTSPLRTTEDIDAAIDMIVNNQADSLVSVMDVPHQFGLDSLMVEHDGLVKATVDKGQYRRQDKLHYVARNGPAILITKPETLKKYDSLYGESILSYKMPSNRSADIDDVDDIDYVRWLISKNNKG